MPIPIIKEQELFASIQKNHANYSHSYFAFYSSWFGGIIKNSSLMLVPIDDHMVHRGDGVFEAVKVQNRAAYLLDEHLDRLLISANKIELKPTLTKDQMKDIIIQTLQAADQNNAMLRIYLSRGPGGFSVNPYESIGPQFYVVVTPFKPVPEDKYKKGVKIGQSTIPCKDAWMAQIKSCNYLHNVLMKKEAVDRHLDFVISLDAEGYIAEGYTENIMMVDKSGQLVYPMLNHILKGITMIRACELAKKEGILSDERRISLQELVTAPEVMMCGTTLDILPVSQFESTPISLGPIARDLYELIREDIQNGPCRTAF